MSEINLEEYEPINLASCSNHQLIVKIRSLITTIESQKEEIEKQNVAIKEYEFYIKNIGFPAQKEIESLKAITELAVKGLEYYSQMTFRSESKFCDGGVKAKSTLSEIARLQNE